MFADSIFDRLARSKAFSTKTVLLISAGGGFFSFLLFMFVFVAAHNIKPMKPYWTAEETTAFWKEHLTGAHVAVGLQLCSGMFYIPFSALISHQIQKIPNIHPIVATTQLAASAAGIFTWMLGAMVLATVTYRLDRNPEITQVMTDMWWFTTMMPWPTFMIQNFAWAYAIIKDSRPGRFVPRWVALTNIAAPIVFVLPTAMHTTKHGALAWNGAVSFFLLGITFGVQLFIDSYFMIKLVLADPDLCNDNEDEWRKARGVQDVREDKNSDKAYSQSSA